MILLNPGHHHHRQRASLMEEVVHIVSGHPKVPLRFGDGAWKRPFEKEVEDEAFNVGAACIVPYKLLFNAVKNEGLSASEIASQYVVSVAYVTFRIKRAGLYRVYQKSCLRTAS